jgi:hypothetical protein
MRGRRRGNDTVNRTAEQLGTLLGQVAARVDAWKQQRAEIQAELSAIVKTANGLITDLGQTATKTTHRVRQTATRARRRFSKATRAKMAEAARRRWALRKSGKSS